MQRLELRGEEEKAPRQRHEHDHQPEHEPPQDKGPHPPHHLDSERGTQMGRNGAAHKAPPTPLAAPRNPADRRPPPGWRAWVNLRPVRPVAGYLRSLDPRLPREVYVLELGALVNAFGNGVVLPRSPHNVRSVGLAGTGVNLACAAAALALEPRLPEQVRRTPRAEPLTLPIPASG